MNYLEKILKFYGFCSPEFSDKVLRLLELAIKFHSPELTKAQIIDKFTSNDPIKILNNLVYYSQQFFFAREKERWEQLIPQWIVDNDDEIYRLCQEMGLCQATKPLQENFDAAIIFGANKSEIFRRLKYLYSLLQTNKIKIKKRIYLLTGHRSLTPRIDGSENYFKHLKSKFGDVLYETHVMIDLYEKFRFSDLLGNIELRVIDTMPVKNCRPNTLDTLEQMLIEMEVSDKRLIFVSRCPAIYEQKAAVEKIFQTLDVYFEVVGGGCNLSEVIDKDKAAYHLLMSLAGAMYENYLNVAKKLDSNLTYSEVDLLKFRSTLGYRHSVNKEVIFSSKALTAMVEK